MPIAYRNILDVGGPNRPETGEVRAAPVIGHNRAALGKNRRIRHHVNPLASRYVEPRALPVERPAHLPDDAPCDVELGCADAKFSLELGARHPERFVVGLEIRERIAAWSQRDADAAGLTNVRIAYCNMNVDLDRVFGPGTVDRFHVLFPDPWFKSRHHKRRVIEPALLRVVASRLREGGELHFASDVYEVALEAMFEVDGDPSAGFTNLAGAWHFWRGNPFGASSRREDTTLARGQRVWRLRWQIAR